VKFSAKRQLVLLAIVLILLVAACSQTAEPAPERSIPTVDISEISATVLAEIEDQLADQPQQTEEPNSEPTDEPEVDIKAIADSVLAQVEQRLAAEAEEVPVILGNEAAMAAEQELELSLISLYQKTNPAVVYIIVPPLGSGSGFVYGEDGTIVTNNHVVDGGTSYEVVFAGGERRSAELIGQDVDSDLAVIQVKDLPEETKPLPLASPDEIQVGQFVVAIGNPFGEQGSMSLGIVSGLDRSLSSRRGSGTGGSYSLPSVIQTDAPINPGNSGGPLLNLDGEVVGVNSAIATNTGTNSGVGFSIPVAAVARIVPSLIEDGVVDYPYIGAAFDDELSLGDQEIYDISRSQGAYVLSVTAGSPADEAGLIAANSNNGRGGDLVIAIDGNAINNFSDLNSYLVFETIVSQTIEITVLRAGEQITLSLTLGSRP
jgi:2-alkenal reductase